MVVSTYSQSDYDRSGLFPDQPSVIPQPPAPSQPIILAVSINFVPSPQAKRQRPKLTIDTSNIQGPLYFTNVTTNHQKKEDKKLFMANEEPIDEEDKELLQITIENTKRNTLIMA